MRVVTNILLLSGFISIDCGIPEGSNYSDETTGIHYISDLGFIDSGSSHHLAPEINNYNQPLLTVRSFPQGTRNCYKLRPGGGGKGNTYLIRATFLYGNYDNTGRTPQFDVYIGVEFWDTVDSDNIRMEMIHTPHSDYINVCLVNTGNGTPFISALELRPLTNSIYTTEFGSLDLFRRRDFGSTTDEEVRYNDDNYDRIWSLYNITTNANTLSSSSEIESNEFQVPSIVMSTANTPENMDESLSYSWTPETSTDVFFVYVHFAEVEELQANESREFNIYLDGDLLYGHFTPSYLSSDTVSTTDANKTWYTCELSIQRTENSTLPPIVNAIEVYTLKKFTNPETAENDVDAAMSIKSMYGVTRNWQGDPCAPQAYAWDGLNCTYYPFDSHRIISLNLSSSGLTGVIARQISNLTMIQSLDLSNNSLTGQVPHFLTQLTSLKVLKLEGNNFTGSVPAELREKSNNGLLSLSIDSQDNNTNPCQSVPCNKKKNKVVVPVVASAVAASLVLLTGILLILWMIKRRKRVVRKVEVQSNENDGSLEREKRQFTYSEILSITNNFQRVIGKGGFGTVYHGYVGDTQVAVKMISPSSIQGYKEFRAETSLLMSIHHKNLTSFAGYCYEGTNMGIVYEYMANGDLDKHLLDQNLYVLGWEERLRIVTDAAQGLEYLHHGCKPPIIHRDVKCTNILLDANFQAKLADFGLSRFFPVEGDTHVYTTVAGTHGYLDPEYYGSNRLTEKSDVYGFGIVLLVMITGRPAIAKNQEKTHIVQWVSSMLQKGDVKNVIDSRIQGGFQVNSVWKAVELAMACVSRTSTKRPTMNSVVMELKECLTTEIGHHDTKSKDPVGLTSINLESGLGPRVR